MNIKSFLGFGMLLIALLCGACNSDKYPKNKLNSYKEYAGLTAIWEDDVYYASFWAYRGSGEFISPLFIYKCGGVMDGSDRFHPDLIMDSGMVKIAHSGAKHDFTDGNTSVVFYDESGPFLQMNTGSSLLDRIRDGDNDALKEFLASGILD